MNKVLASLVIFLNISVLSYGQIPARPEPPHLVNDLAGILSANEVAALEQKLVTFNDSTSTQIVVVTIADLQGYDKNQFAYEVGQTWGVGQKGKNNGIVVLIKPKNETNGQAAISTGYGLEAVVPDILCKRIIETEMIPNFKQNNYYAGIDAAVNTLMSLTKGEYTADQYMKKSKKGNGGAVVIIIIFIIIVIIISKSSGRNNNHHSMGSSSLPFWLLMGGLGSSSGGSSSSWGGGSSGGGGFGGFGGGSFGGGGAGGSW